MCIVNLFAALTRVTNLVFLLNDTIFLFSITFFVCSMNFATSMLFDDRKCPYHLMLQYFVLGGGQDAFFECFRKVFASVELQNELPEWLTEFLDSWLMLLEKMTNPTTLMDSQHLLPLTGTRGGIGFDPTQYLIRVHRVSLFGCCLH